MISTAVAGPGLAQLSAVRWLALLAAGLSGCLYLDAVNLPPIAQIHAPDGPFHIHDAVVLDAAMSSDDTDSAALVYAWSARPCPSCATVTLPPTRQVSVTLDGHDPVLVTLVVRDTHGALSSPATYTLTATDRPPAFGLALTTPDDGSGRYTLEQPVSVAVAEAQPAAADPDGDVVTYRAMLVAPSTSDPNLASLSARGVGAWSVVPDVPGHWQLVVTGDDGYGGVTVRTQGFDVAPDRPPCIAATTPGALGDGHILLLRDAAETRRFAVDAVSDDLDPYPGGVPHFRWFLGPEGAPPAPLAGHDLSDVLVDASDYLPGDVLTLRVEIADRVERTLPCAPDQPRCSIGGDSCFQRLGWTLEVR
jgi:hypothetical protein